MQERLVIGEILKPQGIRGEVKVKAYGNDLSRFLKIKEVYVGDEIVKIVNTRIALEFVFLTFKGVADRNDAEIFRGKILSIDKIDAPKLPDGQYYVIDVIGSVLLDENDFKYGIITDIKTANKDIYTVTSDDAKKLVFPLLKELLIEIDIDKKIVRVKSERLKEVSFYEN